jgi:hypothetical protein
MYRAGDPSLQATTLLLSMDFSGYLIFFISIFHVLHGLYIIALSLFTASEYDQLHSLPNHTLLRRHTLETKSSSLRSFLFLLELSPFTSFSSSRKQFEFKILFALFRHTYWLPLNFHYGLYLSQCLERYSERIMTIGHTGWSFLLVAIVCNYLRTAYGNTATYNCTFLQHTDAPGGNSTDTSGVDDESRSHDRSRCDHTQLRLFCGYGIFMAFYIFIVFFMGRVYTLRFPAPSLPPSLSLSASHLFGFAG